MVCQIPLVEPSVIDTPQSNRCTQEHHIRYPPTTLLIPMNVKIGGATFRPRIETRVDNPYVHRTTYD